MHALISPVVLATALWLVGCSAGSEPPLQQDAAVKHDGPTDANIVQLDGGEDANQQVDAPVHEDGPVPQDGPVQNDGGGDAIAYTVATDIRDLQQDPSRSGTLVPMNTYVDLQGTFVVTAASSTTKYFFLQNPTGPKEYSGIKVRTASAYTGPIPAIGDTVTDLKGELILDSRYPDDAGPSATFHSVAYVTSITIGSAGTVPDPLTATVTQVVTTPEKYDGVLLSLDSANLVVTSTSGSGTSLTMNLSDGTTSSGLAIFTNYYAPPVAPPANTGVALCVGVLDGYKHVYEIYPRTAADLQFKDWPDDGGFLQQDAAQSDADLREDASPPPPDGGACAVGGQVVIAQFYGGGGNSGATYKNDYVVLLNRGTTDVDLSTWSLQYVSPTGTGAWNVHNLSGTIAAGKYFLVQEAAGAGGTTDLPTPDIAGGTLAMGGTNGRVALVKNQTALTGCPALPSATIADLVGYGSSTCYEGSGPTPAVSNTLAGFRAGNGCTDTDVNSADFTTGAPAPVNSSAAAATCCQ
jgi:predicted extracellular nuclease